MSASVYGREISELRSNLGVNGGQLARALAINPATIYRAERHDQPMNRGGISGVFLWLMVRHWWRISSSQREELRAAIVFGDPLKFARVAARVLEPVAHLAPLPAPSEADE